MFTLFEDVKSYVGFSDNDARLLRELSEIAAPHFERMTDHFYECVEANPRAHAIITGPEQADKLKRTLQHWLRAGLEGPHDESFIEQRWHIGRRHLQLELPQRYMVAAINVVRVDYHTLIEQQYGDAIVHRVATHAAIDKLLDLELAIIVESYLEDSNERCRRRERLASIGQLAGNVAHELRNPLGIIESSVYLLRKQADATEYSRKHLDRIAKQVDTCGAIIHNLLELARNRTPRREPIAVDDLFESVLRAISVPSHIAVERNIEPGLTARADPALLGHALSNLIHNAVEAYDGGTGTIHLTASRGDDGGIVIEVRDDGPGFDPTVLSRVFEPLVTTRRDGVGLGLALVKNIAELHGGEARADNPDSGGARVSLRLPLDAEEAK
jgi:signal transduction histidine kinase